MYLFFLNSFYRVLDDISSRRESGYAASSVRPAKPIKKAGGLATAGSSLVNISCSHLDQGTP
jgi:hypothetical protein